MRSPRRGYAAASMFTTLLGALPRPPLPVDAPRDALIEAAIRAQESAGLDPVTDGGPPADTDLARAWSATQRLTDHAVKQAVAGPVHGRAGWNRRRRAQPRDPRSGDRPQRAPARSGRRGLSADRDPRTCGDRDRHRRRRARAVPGGSPAAPRRHRGLTPVAGADRRQRGCRRGRDPARSAVREPGRRPHRRAGQLAARGGRPG